MALTPGVPWSPSLLPGSGNPHIHLPPSPALPPKLASTLAAGGGSCFPMSIGVCWSVWCAEQAGLGLNMGRKLRLDVFLWHAGALKPTPGTRVPTWGRLPGHRARGRGHTGVSEVTFHDLCHSIPWRSLPHGAGCK